MPTLLGETRDRRVSVQDQGDRTTYSETYEFRVKADFKEQAREEILATPGLPIVGSTVSPNLLGVCKSMEAKTESLNPLYWLVTCEFSTPEPGKDANTGSPLDFKPIATFTSDLIDEVSIVDANGVPVINSAGKTFESGFIIKRPVIRISFTQFEPASLALSTIMSRNGVTNSTPMPMLNVTASQLLLAVESAELGTYYNERCWRVKYNMSYKDIGWKLQRLDQGPTHIVSGEVLPYVDKKGNRIIGNLNGSGGMTGNEGKDPPAVLTFSVYPELNFNTFIRL